MSEFSSEMSQWIDSDGLIGANVNPEKWSTGNALLETAFAILYETQLLNHEPDREFIRALCEAILACQIDSGTFNKNPGRIDDITHDCLIGAASVSRVCSSVLTISIAGRLAQLGESNGWNLSNTSSVYWNSYARPWDVPFYKICAGKKPSWYEECALIIDLLRNSFSLLIGKTSPSSDRLKWLKTKALKGASPWIGVTCLFWRFCARRAYVNPGFMMAWYYNNDMHPYAIWGKHMEF